MGYTESHGEGADQAHRYLYKEFNDIIPPLEDNERRLALRLALVPTSSADYWQAMRSPILEGLEEELLDELVTQNVLES